MAWFLVNLANLSGGQPVTEYWLMASVEATAKSLNSLARLACGTFFVLTGALVAYAPVVVDCVVVETVGETATARSTLATSKDLSLKVLV
jgi:hypothetical protein